MDILKDRNLEFCKALRGGGKSVEQVVSTLISKSNPNKVHNILYELKNLNTWLLLLKLERLFAEMFTSVSGFRSFEMAQDVFTPHGQESSELLLKKKK
ncbi:hypothetical protein ACMD2_20246 [Ananas comosus]|uniref:Uncharacterized protein n=1 Tax=Ananas comosus TaxID=4615 RepID=A0A199UPQ1_ANACO|nr:hypothetical protein ACMD2_20246 [Ananas comosus]